MIVGELCWGVTDAQCMIAGGWLDGGWQRSVTEVPTAAGWTFGWLIVGNGRRTAARHTKPRLRVKQKNGERSIDLYFACNCSYFITYFCRRFLSLQCMEWYNCPYSHCAQNVTTEWPTCGSGLCTAPVLRQNSPLITVMKLVTVYTSHSHNTLWTALKPILSCRWYSSLKLSKS